MRLTKHLRELLRLRDGWIDDGRLAVGSPDYDAFSDHLLLVAEHTWGEDLKRFLPDFENYAKEDFRRARARDTIEPRLIPEAYGYLAQWSDEVATHLIDSRGVVWADSDHPLAAYRYQTFGADDFARWINEYCRDVAVHGVWAYADQGKPGLDNVEPAPQNRMFIPRVLRASQSSIDDADVVVMDLRMPGEATET